MSEGSFEAKKHAYRQTQDGIVVSFVIHPNDIDAAFAIAPLGTRYMIGFAEITDSPVAQQVEPPAHNVKVEGSSPSGSTKAPRKPFASLPLSQQAGMRTDDKSFQEFLETQVPIHDEESYADAIRSICGVESRAEIKPGTPAAVSWAALEVRYQDWLTTQRYASTAR